MTDRIVDIDVLLQDCPDPLDALDTLATAEEGVADPSSWLTGDLLPILKGLQVRLIDMEDRLAALEDDVDDLQDGAPPAQKEQGMVSIPTDLAASIVVLCKSVGLDLPAGKTGDETIPAGDIENVGRLLYISLRVALERIDAQQVVAEMMTTYPTLPIAQGFGQGDA